MSFMGFSEVVMSHFIRLSLKAATIWTSLKATNSGGIGTTTTRFIGILLTLLLSPLLDFWVQVSNLGAAVTQKINIKNQLT